MTATVTEHDLARVLRNVLPYAEEELGSLLAQEKKFSDDCDSHEADADIAEANEILAAWDRQ